MLRNGILVLILAVLAAGCGGVKAQGYVMTTKRVDIKDKSGNAGYISGKGQYQEPIRKTRKVYVLELTKAIPEGEVKKVEQVVAGDAQEEAAKVPVAAESHAAVVAREEVPQETRKIVLPKFEDEPVAAVEPVKNSAVLMGPAETQMYTVLKDDTLQKIAKKFYGSYGKWIKLYEANKDKLKNPNFVRPGTVLTIPSLEEIK